MEDDLISQDDFLKAFGVESTEPTTEEPTTDPTDNQEGANPGTEEQPTEPQNDGENTDNQGDQQPANTNTADKTSQAFASMRVELAQKNKMLENVATVLGLDPKSKDSMDQLQNKLTEALAKKQGLSVETLQRLNRLEELEQQRNIEQARNNAFAGFQQVKNKFGLNDEQLQSFANELVAEGKNPFVQNLDLVTEYKLKNFDRLLEQAKNQGIQDEAARAAKANANASTPSNTTGGSVDPEPEKITTVKELTNWFNQQQGGK